MSNQRAEMITVTVTTTKTLDRQPPGPPTSASVNLAAFSDSRIDIVWGASPSSDVGSYEVRRDGKLVATVQRPGAQRYSDNGLKPSSLHSYTVLAVDTAGNRSVPTAAKTIQTLPANEVSIRRGPYVSNVSATTALVSWWSNIAATGTVSVAGRSVTDPKGAVQHHTVAVTGLRPGTLYPYSISTGQDSAQGSFRTAAPAGQTFSFAAIGDFGSGNIAERETVAGIASADTAFIQTVGDNVYPSAGAPDPDFTTKLSDFDARLYRPLAPILQTQAFFPANGNKEYYSDGAFWANFPMPGKNHSWYSYNWGDAHILVIDTEQPFDPGSAQYAYVRADLAAHQKEAWRIVAMQRPPYSSTSINSSDEHAQESLVPLFQTFRVSLVLSGNSHNYERSFPLIDGRPVRGDGVTYIVTGAGGNLFTLFAAPVPAYSAFREDTSYEFVKVTVGPKELVAQAIGDEGRTVIDRTTITTQGERHHATNRPDRRRRRAPDAPGRLPQLESQYGQCRRHRLSGLPGRRPKTDCHGVRSRLHPDDPRTVDDLSIHRSRHRRSGQPFSRQPGGRRLAARRRRLRLQRGPTERWSAEHSRHRLRARQGRMCQCRHSRPHASRTAGCSERVRVSATPDVPPSAAPRAGRLCRLGLRRDQGRCAPTMGIVARLSSGPGALSAALPRLLL